MVNMIVDNKEVEIEWLEFSDGALTCKLIDFPDKEINNICLTVDPTTKVSLVIEELALIYSSLAEVDSNFLDQEDDVNVTLNLPYLPYGRADRRFENGNPVPLESFLGLLSQMYVHTINLVDPHNEFAVKNFYFGDAELIIKPQYRCVIETIKSKILQTYDYIIAPDKGAVEKATKLSEHLNIPVVCANKKRDLNTGRIIETTLETEVELANKKVLIVDDILDGGGTFIPLSEKLKSEGASVDLYITHLIAVKGLDLFKGLIDNIYCYHTVGKYINRTTVMYYNLGK